MYGDLLTLNSFIGISDGDGATEYFYGIDPIDTIITGSNSQIAVFNSVGLTQLD